MSCNTEHPDRSVENQVSFFEDIWKDGPTTSSPSSVSEDTTSIYSVRRCKFIYGIGPVLFKFCIFMEIQRQTQFLSEGKMSLWIQMIKHAANPTSLQTHPSHLSSKEGRFSRQLINLQHLFSLPTWKINIFKLVWFNKIYQKTIILTATKNPHLWVERTLTIGLNWIVRIFPCIR